MNFTEVPIQANGNINLGKRRCTEQGVPPAGGVELLVTIWNPRNQMFMEVEAELKDYLKVYIPKEVREKLGIDRRQTVEIMVEKNTNGETGLDALFRKSDNISQNGGKLD